MHTQFVRRFPSGDTGLIAIDLDAVMAYGPSNNGDDVEIWLGGSGVTFTLVVPFDRFDAMVKESDQHYNEPDYDSEDDGDFEEDESWRLN